MSHQSVLLAVLLVSLSLTVSITASTCGYGPFDFSQLESASLVASGQSGSYDYDYYIALCGVTNISANCLQNSATICQMRDGQFISDVAEWTSASSGKWAYVNSSDPYAGVTLSFANGDPCFPTTNPRTATITFVCGPNLAGPITATSNGEPPCNYDFTIPTSLACGHPVCGLGNQDFSSLTAEEFYTVKDEVGYEYEVNICGPIHDKTRCGANSGALCQFYNDQLVSVDALADHSGVWSYVDPNKPDAGLQLVYNNGDSCYPSTQPRTVVYTFTCSNEFSLSLNQTSPCAFDVGVQTPLACSN